MRFSYFLPLLVFLFAGCADRAEDRAPIAERTVEAVATTNIVADVVRQVGGGRVNVTALMGPGVDPHLYRASEGDLGRMQRADIVFYNGLDLEGKMADVLERLGERQPTVAVADGVPADQLVRPEAYQGSPDPHVWMNAAMWQAAADAVGKALAELDPAHETEYLARAQAFADTLTLLDRYARRQAATVPTEQRVLVTAHDAFGYFGRAYGFEVRGLQGLSTATEAGTADVQALADFVAERRIPALFVETSIPPRTIEAVREAVRARGFDVEIGGSLYSDALGGAGSGAEDYPAMFRHNVDTIVGALRGSGEGERVEG